MSFEITDPKDILIHVGDTPLLQYQCVDKVSKTPIDLSGVSVKELYFTPPLGGTVLKKTFDFVSDGRDGQIQYQCVKTDLSEPGVWYVEAYTENGALAFTYSGGRLPVEPSQKAA